MAILTTVPYQRISVVEAYFRLHRMGISQGILRDEERRNILVREDGSPCLIDFTYANLRHRCQLENMPWLTTQLRSAPAFSCSEVHNIVASTDVYEDGEDFSILLPLRLPR